MRIEAYQSLRDAQSVVDPMLRLSRTACVRLRALDRCPQNFGDEGRASLLQRCWRPKRQPLTSPVILGHFSSPRQP